MFKKYQKNLKAIRQLHYMKKESGSSCRDIYLDAKNKCVYKIDTCWIEQNYNEIQRWKKYGKEYTLLNTCLAYDPRRRWVCQRLVNTETSVLRAAWIDLLGLKFGHILKAIENYRVLSVEDAYDCYPSLPKKQKTKKFLTELIYLADQGVCDFDYQPTRRQWGVDRSGNIRLCDYGC